MTEGSQLLQLPNRTFLSRDLVAIPFMERTGPKRVLFVDENDVARSTVPRLLAIHGFDVTAVATTDHALGEIKSDNFDVLLCAVRVGCTSALELISEMNTAQSRCICFVLVDDDQEELRTALKGRAVYIRKPLSTGDLVKTISEKLTG